MSQATREPQGSGEEKPANETTRATPAPRCENELTATRRMPIAVVLLAGKASHKAVLLAVAEEGGRRQSISGGTGTKWRSLETSPREYRVARGRGRPAASHRTRGRRGA